MADTQWTVVWPDGREPVIGANTDRYELLDSEDAVRELVRELDAEYHPSEKASGAPAANVLVFPPNTSRDARASALANPSPRPPPVIIAT